MRLKLPLFYSNRDATGMRKSRVARAPDASIVSSQNREGTLRFQAAIIIFWPTPAPLFQHAQHAQPVGQQGGPDGKRSVILPKPHSMRPAAKDVQLRRH